MPAAADLKGVCFAASGLGEVGKGMDGIGLAY